MKKITFTVEAWEDYLYWQKNNKPILARVNELIKEILRTPFEGKGKPEPLRYELQGMWSRRIDHTHRIVYSVANDAIAIVALRFHYE